MNRNEKPYLFLDLGTNAEMAVGNRERMLVSSAAAGPAFEGGQLSCGTGSIPGAVRDVRIQYGLVRYETIGRKPPVGICGSGLVSAISEMRKSRMMDNTGRLSPRYASGGLEIIPERLSLPRRISESTRKPERLSAPDLRYWLRTPGIGWKKLKRWSWPVVLAVSWILPKRPGQGSYRRNWRNGCIF